MNLRTTTLIALALFLGLNTAVLTAQNNPFIITVKTDNPGDSGPAEFEIPTDDGTYTYNYEVDWNNDGVYEQTGINGDVTHDFGSAGIYTIRIRGQFPAIYFDFGGDAEKILSVDQWGDIQWESFRYAFAGAHNLTSSATDAPDLSSVTDMENMFDEAHVFNADIGHWDVSNVTDMESMFEDAHVFNADIGNWDVSNVTDMEDMFQDAYVFNQDIGNWDVSNVTNMEEMFEDAHCFNQDIGNWDVSKVTDMNEMFDGAYVFNADIGNWDVSNVTRMDEMFEEAYTFNQDIGRWDVSSVERMDDMFEEAYSFNQDIGDWDVSNVERMDDMFNEAYVFNQDLSDWDVSNVNNMLEMFKDAYAFNQDIGGWDISSVNNMSGMLDNSGLSIGNYDATLIGWAGQVGTPSNITLGAEGLLYCNGEAARDELIMTYGWIIYGDAQADCFAGGPNDNIGAAPNCSNFSPAINEKGQAVVSPSDFLTNVQGVESSPTITVYNQWGGILPGYPRTFVARDDDFTWYVCDYLGKTLNFSVSNGAGICNEGYINLNGTPGVQLTSAFGHQKPWFGDNATDGKVNVYCGQVPDPSEHVPAATAPCGGSATIPTAQPDWVMTVPCDEVSDTAEIIFRTWESYDKEGNLSTLTDTIVVFRLPKLTPGAFVGASEENYYCDIEAIPNNGESLKRYASWKQPVGLHDYELPYSKLRGVTYEIPGTIILAGLVNAYGQGPNVLDEYLACVILRKADGSEVTIGDIVSGDYMDNLIANASNEQLGYGFLQALIELNEKPLNVVLNVLFEFYPYLLLQEGDWILSEGGNFEKVDSDWFFNGNGHSPYWFAGGWPSIYGSGDCVSFCDVGAGKDFGCIKIRVPVLDIDEGIYDGECQIICLPTGVHCGITIKQDPLTAWTGSCPQTRGVDSWITQTCWAETPNWCAEDAFGEGQGDPIPCEDISADDNPDDAVIGYECTDKAVKIHISQWQTLIDNIPPIFDFCYPLDYGFFNGMGDGPGQDNLELPDPEHFEPLFLREDIREGYQPDVAYFWEHYNPTVYTTGSHDCAAEVFVPSVKLIDNCSGVHSVKAMVEVKGGVRAVALDRTDTEIRILANGDTCTVYTYSHTTNPIRVPFTGCYESIPVEYEAADNCWNQSYWTKYIRIEDATPPTVVMDREITVSLSDKVAWMHAESIDEGSWDNCAIDLRLARRTDWMADTACVDLCKDLGPNAPYDNWVDLLDDLGVDREQAVTAVGGGYVYGYDFHSKYNVNDLKTFLNEGEVEQYYFNQIKWLWEDEYCGEKVVHGWLYSIAAYIAENCSELDDHGNPLDLKDLEDIFDNLFHTPGYGKEMAFLGGGWSKSVPFKCEDACEEVMAELLVMDYCCNWWKSWTTVHVEDKSPARLVKRLPDLDISCESYNLFYKDAVEAAAAYNPDGGSAADSTGAYAALDAAFGHYIKTWVDNQNRPTDIDGNLLPDSVLNFDYHNVTCEEKSETEQIAVEGHDGHIDWITEVSKTTYLDTAEQTGMNGIIAINCAGSCEQDVWIDLDECGQGTIIRRFFVKGGCGPKAPSWEIEQVINVESACGMRESMFNLPANVGSKEAPICLPEGLSNTYLPDTIGSVTLKTHLEGKLCNSIAIGSDVKELDVLGTNMKKYLIDWTVIDWCAPHTEDLRRQFTYTQEVIATIDPTCDVSTGVDTSGDVSLVQGSIATELGEAVQKVEMKAVLGSGSPLTTVTSGDGAYSFSVNDGSQVSLVPSKNTGHANGVSTQDLIDIQRHVLQKESLDSKYRRIAADVNANGSIDGLDVLELRKLIMKPDSKFANNTSWRFYDTNTDKEVYDVANVNGDVNVDFVGVKIGDVNLSGDPARSSRSTTGNLHLNVADKTLKGGELYRVDVTSDNFADITGLQYTMSYVTNLVEVESIEAGALNITKENYLRYAPGVITSSWSEADGQNLSSDVVLFTIVLKAKSEVQLRDALSLNSRVTTTEAYDAAGGLKDVSLRFDGEDSGFALYQNTPNPYAGQTVIGFKLPEASKATLSVYDVTGKVLKIVEGEYEAGYNEIRMRSAELGTTGVLYYQLDTDKFTATKKMIVVE